MLGIGPRSLCREIGLRNLTYEWFQVCIFFSLMMFVVNNPDTFRLTPQYIV